MKINNHDTDKRVFVVAEIGNNHEGDFSQAERLVHAAAIAGADAVKFQTFIPELFVTSADTARIKRMRDFQLSFSEFESLSKLANSLGIIFFSTPLDLESARFLNTIQSVFKIASGDNSFYPLIELIASFGKPLIVSTGLSDAPLLHGIRELIIKNSDIANENTMLAFLHCVTSYPTPPEQLNLRAIHTLRQMFPNSTVGYSDHSLGINACLYAVAAGARIIEKHFTLDKNFSDFRDHQLSADPGELKNMILQIRELEQMLGSGARQAQECEELLRPAVRRSIACANDIEAGTILTKDHLCWVRPGSGLPPGEEGQLIGKKAICSLEQGTLILREHVRDK